MMALPEIWLNEWVRWLIATARFGGALALMPGLAVRHVPIVARMTVAFGAALTGLKFVPAFPLDNFVLIEALLVREFAVGMLIGFSFASFVWLVEWAAELADWQAGFGFSALVDPLMGTRVAIMARAATLLAGVLFFQLGGHHWLLRTVVATYQWLPVGTTVSLKPKLGEAWLSFAIHGLMIVLPFTLPALGIVLLTDFLLGLMGRAAPQLSVLLWGMPVRIAVALFVIAASFVVLPVLAEKLLQHIATSVPSLLVTMR